MGTHCHQIRAGQCCVWNKKLNSLQNQKMRLAPNQNELSETYGIRSSMSDVLKQKDFYRAQYFNNASSGKKKTYHGVSTSHCFTCKDTVKIKINANFYNVL